MTDRIQTILRSFSLSPSQLADEIAVQRSSLSHILSGRNKPSLDFITRVLTSYPQLSPDWLLFGKGSMLRRDETSEADDHMKKEKGTAPDSTDAPSMVGFGKKEKAERAKAAVPEGSTHRNESAAGKGAQQVILLFEDGSFKSYIPS
jgi:transcriptional regulator with XRE-family HTH domain